MPEFYVIKQNGERQIFDYGKLESSLRRTGADEKIIADIVKEVSGTVYDGITTDEIYKKAFSILHKKHNPAAIRYSLKKAVAELGPTGFPFEKFVAEIFKAQGYEAVTDQIIQGKCVEHEVDVVAWKGDELIMCEAKFHTDFAIKSDLKIALYVKARWDDIFGRPYTFGGKQLKLTEGWLITNTKFSLAAIKYDQCQPAFRLVGWNYPFDENLHHLIERYHLVPVTALTSLSTPEKNRLIEEGIVLSKSLLDEKILKDMKFDDKKIETIQQEVKDLMENAEFRLQERHVQHG
jgi:hypothetical protein